MEFRSIPLSSPSVRPSYTLFTTNHDYHTNVIANVKPHSLIYIASYNVGITDDHTETLAKFVDALCKAARVRLLVGTNVHHDKNKEIFGVLKRWSLKHKNLEVRTLNKLHVKTILIDNGDKNPCGWAGSLNFANITLHEIMLRLNATQVTELWQHVQYLWTLGIEFRPVQKLNKTKKSK